MNIFFKGGCISIRICRSLDGKFSYKEEIMPWFKKSAYETQFTKMTFFCFPYLLFGIFKSKRPEGV